MAAAPHSTGRLAPSPTGPLHLGHARSFLLAWLHARSRGGRILLRIEDLDRERCKPEFTTLALADLAWLGLDWDGAPHIQSTDRAPLETARARLTERNAAYPCICTRAEIAAALARSTSAPHAGDELYYPGTCRDLTPRPTPTTPVAWRFRCPDASISFDDELLGQQHFHPAREVGDFAIARRDGAIAYQLAVVVDDARAGVDEILRGADLLPSTARQILLQRALGLPQPRWWHLPLVVGDDGKRLAKRSGGFALAELRARGVDPRAVVAWALRSSGLDAPERVTAAQACQGFALANIARTPARFGAQELDSLLAARA